MVLRDVALYLKKLEATTSRNAMVEILAELLSKVSSSEIDKLIYLMQGRIAPLYVHLEMGMADKMMCKAIAMAYNHKQTEVGSLFKKMGDLGKVSEALAQREAQDKKRTVTDVYDALRHVAETNGEGSVEQKIERVARLLASLDPLSARFVSRIPVGKLRLGFSDMTVLDSFSWMLTKSKTERPTIESAYNVRPDLGFIGKTIKEKGVAGLRHVKPNVFTPILMARAERLSSAKEILEKIGECSIESKVDGFRLQVHYKRSLRFSASPAILKKNKESKSKNQEQVKLFTRNLEDVTFMYPDIVEGVLHQIGAQEAIFEGEAIAYDPNTGEFLPFQETVQRKRKYGIEDKVKEIPLKMICFDLLYVNGQSFIKRPFVERRKQLEKSISKGDVLLLSEVKTTDDEKEIDLQFDNAVAHGLEGIMAKRLDGVYQAGARGWNWIKYKRSYSGSLEDTIDTLVMGYYYGKGKRTSFGIGAFLIGVYDKEKDKFVSITKVGTGLTDEEWKELFKRCNKLKAREKPPLYEVDKLLEPDVWIEPDIVVEIRADEITRSSIHTAGRVLKPSKSGSAFEVDIPGFALRFPRLERFRDDRKPEDATALSEIEKMFEDQRKHLVKNAK